MKFYFLILPLLFLGSCTSTITDEDDKESDVIKLLSEKASKQDDLLSNPLNIPTYDGSNQTTHPSILYFPKKWKGWKYWLAHTPYPKSVDYYENPSIVVSNDGINWVSPNNIITSIDEVSKEDNNKKYHYSDTELVYRPDKNILECWYRYGKNEVLEQLWRRTTSDGINWSQKELIIDESKPYNLVMSPTVVWENGIYKMWTVSTNPSRVEYRESSDGKIWKNLQNLKLDLPTGIAPWHISVKKTDLGYEMLLDVFNPRNKDLNTKFLMNSLSSDGINWSKFNNSILASDKKDKWNGKMIYRSSFIKVNRKYIVFYSGMSYSHDWRIGIAYGNKLDSLKYN